MGEKKLNFRRPKVFDFHDYRQFLSAWLDYKKEVEPGFSLRKLAIEIGASPSYISMILSGERKLKGSVLDSWKELLEVSESEFNYLKCLQILSDSDSQEERLIAIKKMQKFGRYKNQHTNEVKFYKYLSRWYCVAIKEMTELKSFVLDVDWIQKRLVSRVSRDDIRKAIEFLVKEEFIIPDGKGGFEASEKALKCEGSIFKSGLSSFHKQMFEKAIRSIDVTPAEQRWIFGNTVAISKRQFSEVVEIMKEANEKINQIAKRKEENEVVYHTGFLAFPLTKGDQK